LDFPWEIWKISLPPSLGVGVWKRDRGTRGILKKRKTKIKGKGAVKRRNKYKYGIT
jgi:hypothetical protein